MAIKKNNFEIIYKEKDEMPVENIEKGFVIKNIARLLYLFSRLTNTQHEIIILAKKTR